MATDGITVITTSRCPVAILTNADPRGMQPDPVLGLVFLTEYPGYRREISCLVTPNRQPCLLRNLKRNAPNCPWIIHKYGDRRT